MCAGSIRFIGVEDEYVSLSGVGEYIRYKSV